MQIPNLIWIDWKINHILLQTIEMASVTWRKKLPIGLDCTHGTRLYRNYLPICKHCGLKFCENCLPHHKRIIYSEAEVISNEVSFHQLKIKLYL